MPPEKYLRKYLHVITSDKFRESGGQAVAQYSCRAYLRSDEQALSETWLYRFIPRTLSRGTVQRRQFFR